MNLRPRTMILILACAMAAVACTSDNVIGSQSGAADWKLVWNESFDGPSGSAPDAAHWNMIDGVVAWNGELQYYTARPVNVELDGGGKLAIHLLRDSSFAGYDYTSGRLTTEGHFAQAYGRFEASIRMPRGQAVWPAFWMLGDNCDMAMWPSCGGIDVAEAYGQQPNTVLAGIHAPGYPDTELVRGYVLGAPPLLSADFHAYATEWEPDEIRWYVDDVLWRTQRRADLPVGAA